MKTKKDAIVEPAVHTDSSTSHDTSLETLEYTVKRTDAAWIRALKILETAEPAEILEKPVLLTDGRWLTAEEFVEYAKTVEESA
ncbi:MAG TPA: hypothetical protein PKB15_07645 [Acidimicrobiia bacterium]|nr:hypothetical protein [Acidimicrobiia bacterium]